MKNLTLENVSKRLAKISIKRAKIYMKQEKLLNKLEDESKEIVSRCPHNFVYHSDPSGNNDSGYCCSACQMWKRRLV